MELTRRTFMGGSFAAAAAVASGAKAAPLSSIPGFDEAFTDEKVFGPWQPFSDKKVRVGIAGYGVCKFGAQFFFQNHPNVEVVAAADLFKDRCEELAKLVGAKRTYSSAEEMMDKEGKN
ncbi:MAG: Gfo/Idh/MocA family protein, partial [bacterium]